MSRAVRFAPLLLVALVIAALIWRLAHPVDTVVRSKLVGQPIPGFELPPAVASKPGLRSTDLATGRPRLLNIFASWCVPCIAEVPILERLRAQGVQIDGIAIRDKPDDITRFLANHGDPYSRIGADDNSRVQMALGSSGVPESFVIDGRGTIRHQHVGPILDRDVPALLAAIEQAR